jgi:DNA polymerase (family 10)
MPRQNEAVAQLLDNIARLLTLQRDDQYRIRAYTEAAIAVDSLDEDVRDLHAAGRLEEIPGVGPSIAAKIAEYLDTGRSSYVEELERELAPDAPDLLEVPSIGPARAKMIREQLGISSVAELERAARDHRLQRLPGIGAKLEARIADEAARAVEQADRMPNRAAGQAT